MLNRIFLFIGACWLLVISFSCAWNSARISKETTSSSASEKPASPIRFVNFDKLSYPNFPDYSGDEKKRVTLAPGEGGPNFLTYGDLTGDGTEDAAIALGIPSQGTAITYYSYIYTIVQGSPQPKLLWDFETGDRADGGLRNVYGENGQLVIELFGKNRIIGDQLYRGDEPLCCPSSFTRTFYRWNGKSFDKVQSEVLQNPAKDAAPVMTTYKGSNDPQ